jgi:hypothetical protein
MLGHLVYNGHASDNDGYVRVTPALAGWMRRVLGALFRRH